MRLIDLTQLPPPDVVEELNFEVLLAARKAKFLSLWPEAEQALWAERLEMEAEPVTKLLEENAYLEMLLRSRINHAARSVMLAFAAGADLDHLGALFGVQRLLIQAEDLTQDPPVLAVYESDERFRRRIQLALDSFTTAGSRSSYLYHTLTASGKIKDANISSPEPGTVLVTVLADKTYGTANSEMLAIVSAALNAEEVRPLTDTVNVAAAAIINYQINAEITLYPTAIESVILDNVRNKINEYADKQYRLGLDITRSGIFAALHQEGVQNVRLITPAVDLVITPTQAGNCTNISLSIRGRDE